jgi:hypothetical protein
VNGRGPFVQVVRTCSSGVTSPNVSLEVAIYSLTDSALRVVQLRN